ncbi:MAG: hypothetical protein U1G07_16630 [Verrucomicrobiota bacterium]
MTSASRRPTANHVAWRALLFALIVAGHALQSPTEAILFISTADPSFHTTAPPSELGQTGWELQGRWGDFLGSPIGPHHFITARHVGGGIGDPFQFGGVAYMTAAFWDNPAADLRIWQVEGTFPIYAKVYSQTDEVGKEILVFGRGTERGAPVVVATAAGLRTNGWLWGVADGVMRWGQNQVASIEDGDLLDSEPEPVRRIGDLLRSTFDADAGPNEAHLSVGDSGGAVFIRDGEEWKLAGINYAVTGAYNFTNSGAGFSAAILDERGLFLGEENDWTFQAEGAEAVPGAFYATRLSVHLPWIQRILSGSSSTLPLLQSAVMPGGPYVDDPGAVLSADGGEFQLPLPPVMRFYRVQGDAVFVITAVGRANDRLAIQFQAAEAPGDRP